MINHWQLNQPESNKMKSNCKISSLTSSNSKIWLNYLGHETVTSTWLTTLLLKNEGYFLTKQLFYDLVQVRYVCKLSRVPEFCECCGNFSLHHALSCKTCIIISDVPIFEGSMSRCFYRTKNPTFNWRNIRREDSFNSAWSSLWC